MDEGAGGWASGRLLGIWSFEREISGYGGMSGVATFEPIDGDRSLYEESGELRLDDGQRLHAERRYVYEWLDKGFAVYFHDTGELFHRVTFADCGEGEWRASANHLCKADSYISEYLFGVDGTFEVRHEVRGPKKDYMILTVYRRNETASR